MQSTTLVPRHNFRFILFQLRNSSGDFFVSKIIHHEIHLFSIRSEKESSCYSRYSLLMIYVMSSQLCSLSFSPFTSTGIDLKVVNDSACYSFRTHERQAPFMMVNESACWLCFGTHEAQTPLTVNNSTCWSFGAQQ